MRPTVRLKMTLLYAGVVFVAGALLLSVSYVLVRQNLTNPSNLRNLPAGNWSYNVAAQHEIAQDALARLRTQYGIALFAMTGFSVLLVWALAGRMLRPLQRITATAQRVSQDNLDERIGLEGPRDELKELADTFDGMLERLSGAFASQRRFVANASHELRTPLTVIRTELEVSLADPNATTAELRSMAETVRDATLGTERLIQALLTLARSEGGIQRRDDVDLAEAARMALAHTGSEAAARHVDMRPTLDPAPVRGDRGLLDRLVANLVENAVRHNRDRGMVEVRTASVAGRSTVEVRNDGEIVPPEAVPSLLEPFQRLDRGARGDGVGLGLSIVRSVARPTAARSSSMPAPRAGSSCAWRCPRARTPKLTPTLFRGTTLMTVLEPTPEPSRRASFLRRAGFTATAVALTGAFGLTLSGIATTRGAVRPNGQAAAIAARQQTAFTARHHCRHGDRSRESGTTAPGRV